MSTRNVIESSTTITGGGGTSTSSAVSLEEDESMTLQVEGDSNSTNLDFEIQAKVDSIDNWAVLDNLTGEDLTTGNVDNKIYQYDVLDLEELRVITTNNDASSTTVKIVTQHTSQQ